VHEVLHDQARGNFELTASRRVRSDSDRALDLSDEASIAQLQRRHVHRDAHDG
jgi:hypothetical protein